VLKADLRAEHQPANTTEEILVNEMAEQFWRIRRARRYEAMVLDNENVVLAQLTAVQRMMTAAERGFHKALITLRQMQKERGFVPQNVESIRDGQTAAELIAESCELTASSGFVPQKPESTGECQAAAGPTAES
jgi:hypothetical protein